MIVGGLPNHIYFVFLSLLLVRFLCVQLCSGDFFPQSKILLQKWMREKRQQKIKMKFEAWNNHVLFKFKLDEIFYLVVFNLTYQLYNQDWWAHSEITCGLVDCNARTSVVPKCQNVQSKASWPKPFNYYYLLLVM